MGHDALPVVLSHLPRDIMLSFGPNGHVAAVKYLILSKVQLYLYQSVSLHDQPFSIPFISISSISLYHRFSIY